MTPRTRRALLFALISLVAGGIALIGLWEHDDTHAPASPRATQVAPKGIRVSGRVVDSAAAPIAGAEVSARGIAAEAGATAASAKTSADGRFELHVPPGRYDLLAHREGFVDEAARDLTVPRAEPIELALERAGALRGKVVDGPGAPAAGAVIRLRGSGLRQEATATADAEGAFVLPGVPAGIYEVQARRADEVSPAAQEIQVEAGGEAWVALQLSPGATLSARITHAETGATIPDAFVMLEDPTGGPIRRLALDASGRVTVTGLPPVPHRLVAQAAGFVPRAGLGLPGGEIVELPLQRAATLRGEVVDEQGEPVHGAELELVSEDGRLDPGGVLGLLPAPGDSLGVTLGTVPKVPLFAPVGGAVRFGLPPVPGATEPVAWRTDASGRFSLEPVAAGTVRIVARHPDFAPGQSELQVVGAGAEVDGVRITLQLGGAVAGTVLDADGSPVPGTRVDLAVGADARSTVSDREGAFSFRPVRGAGTVTARAPGEPPVEASIEVEPGAEVSVVLSLSGESEELIGDVTGPSGEPVAGAVVRVTTLSGSPVLERTAVTDPQGAFAVPGLPRASCRVAVEHGDHVPTSVEAVPGGEPVHLLLARGMRLQVVLRDAFDESPVPGATLTLRGGAPASGRSSGSGEIAIRSVNQGEYLVSIQHPRYATESLTAVVDGSQEIVDLGVVALTPAGWVSGDVVDRFGSAVEGAQVAAGDPPRWAKAARSDRQGRFELFGLSPGEQTVVARATRGGRSDGVVVRVHPGEESGGIVLRLPESGASDDAPETEPAPAARATGTAVRETSPKPGEEGESEASPKARLETGVAVSLGYAEGAVRIGAVLGEAARAAGLRSGDALLRVDGEDVLAVAQARALLRGAVGSSAQLELRRGGKAVRTRVTREGFSP